MLTCSYTIVCMLFAGKSVRDRRMGAAALVAAATGALRPTNCGIPKCPRAKAPACCVCTQGDGYVSSRAAGAAALVASAAAAASAAALASVVPLWFCIACPVGLPQPQ